MNKIKKIILAIVIILAIFGLGYYLARIYVNSIRTKLNAYIEPMYKDIVNHQWDKKTYLNYACPITIKWLQNRANMDSFEKTLTYAANELGAMQSYDGILGFNIKTNDKSKMAIVVVKMTFEKGPRVFVTQLMQNNNQWCLVDFSMHYLKK